jgi:TPR repeat protein
MRRILVAVVGVLCFSAVAVAEDGPSIQRAGPGELCDALAGHPDDADSRGDGVEYEAIDAARAQPACRDAVAAAPGERRYVYQLARALRKAGKVTEAIPLFEKAGSMGSSIALIGAGLIHEDGDGVATDYAKAADYYRRAMAIGSVLAISNLAWLYDRDYLGPNGAAEAKKLYEQQIAAGDNYGLVDLGALYQWGRGVAKDEAKAEELFRKAIADSDPDIAATGKNQLAWMWATTNRNLTEAEILASEAVVVTPDEDAYLDTRAWARHRLGRDEEALADAQKAIAIAPEQPGYQNRLGDILSALGKPAEAKAAWQKALSLTPPDNVDEPDWDAGAIRRKIAETP